MTTESILASEQTYQYFLQESAELLQTMDDELQQLRTSFSIQKVHNLMRAAHTLKMSLRRCAIRTR
jgi:two-component system, chemotaxis family, sensor histidine kinase and response regulator PixL